MPKREPKDLIKAELARALSPFEEFERWFEDFFKRSFSLMAPSWWQRLRPPEREELTPSVDIFEERGDVVVKAELPGMKKEDIDVKLTDDNIITISGEKKKEEKIERENYYRAERLYGTFTRSFHLPTDVQIDKVKAKFEDGVLEIRIPKTEEAIKKERKVFIE